MPGIALKLALALGVGAAWLAPSAVAATTTIGEQAPIGATFSGLCCSFIQDSSAAGPPAYAVPAAPAGESWTITSWSARGGAVQGFARLLVWRPTGVAGQFRLVARSADQVIDAASLPSIATSLPAQPGDLVGIRTDSHHDVQGGYITASGDDVYTVNGDPAVNETVGGGGTYAFVSWGSTRANVQATLTSSSPPTASLTGQRAAALKKCKNKHPKKKRKKCIKKALELPL
jgi:hypothetical protein